MGGRMRGGRDFDEAPSKAFPWRGRCHEVTDEGHWRRSRQLMPFSLWEKVARSDR